MISPEQTVLSAKKLASAIYRAGRAHDLGCLVNDEDFGMAMPREHLFATVRAVALQLGVKHGSIDELLASLRTVPKYCIPIVLWIGEELIPTYFMPDDMN